MNSLEDFGNVIAQICPFALSKRFCSYLLVFVSNMLDYFAPRPTIALETPRKEQSTIQL